MKSSLQSKVNKPGSFICFRSDGRSLTWQSLTQTRQAASRFAAIQRAAIFEPPHNEEATTGSLALLAARLVCLDGIRPEALEYLHKSAATPYRCGEHFAIEWTEGEVKRVERRFIFPLTLALWPKSEQAATLGLTKSDTAQETSTVTSERLQSEASTVPFSVHAQNLRPTTGARRVAAIPQVLP